MDVERLVREDELAVVEAVDMVKLVELIAHAYVVDPIPLGQEEHRRRPIGSVAADIGERQGRSDRLWWRRWRRLDDRRCGRGRRRHIPRMRGEQRARRSLIHHAMRELQQRARRRLCG